MPLADGRVVVEARGTAVPLAARSVAGGLVTLCAEADNTGAVVVGASTVVAAAAGRRGVPLFADPTRGLTSITLHADDLAGLFVDAEVDGEGITYLVR